MKPTRTWSVTGRKSERSSRKPQTEAAGRFSVDGPFRREDIVDLQRSAGNAAVGVLLRQPATPQTGSLDPDAAVVDLKRRFSKTSIQTIQTILGGYASGKWERSWVASLMSFQARHALPADGRMGQATLDLMVSEGRARGMQTEIIHLVAEFFAIDIHSDTLSTRYSPVLRQPSVVESSYGLDRISIGDPAMTDAATIKAALEETFEWRGYGHVPTTTEPRSGMGVDEAIRAAVDNGRTLQDQRSVQTIQGFLGESPTGSFTSGTSHRLADFQAKAGLSTARGDRGRVTDETFRLLIGKLIGSNDVDAAVRLIIDWYRIVETGVLDIRVEPTQVASYQLFSADRPGPSILTLGPSAFAFGHESLVHTIEQACAEARTNATGLAPEQQVFLGWRARVLSRVDDTFATDPDPARSLGFVKDARLALDAFEALDPRVQQKLKEAFESVGRRVLARYEAAEPGERAAHAALLGEYRAHLL